MTQVIAFDTSIPPHTITLVALVKSAVDSGLAFANAVVSERHIMEQLEVGFDTDPDSLCLLSVALSAARRDAIKAGEEFGIAIEGLRKMGQDEEIEEINDEITSRTEYVRLNPAIRYPKAITC